MPNRRSFKIPLYPGWIIVINTSDPKEVKKLVKGYDFQDGEVYGHTIAGFIKIDKIERNCYYVILNTKHKQFTTGLISHEALHVCKNVWSAIGYRPENDNSEPENYLLDWVVDHINFCLK